MLEKKTKNKINYTLQGLELPFVFIILLLVAGCKKEQKSATPQDVLLTFTVNNTDNGSIIYNNLTTSPVIRFQFSTAIDAATLPSSFLLTDNSNTAVPVATTLQNKQTVVVIPSSPLKGFSTYRLTAKNIKSESGGNLVNPVIITLQTGLDSSDKFPQISDSALVQKVQEQTFKYFWDFAHPVSGLARERNTSGETVTSGGSGFGIMALLTGIHRGFISRAQGLDRLQTIVSFLKNKAQRFHGAFPHWLNGTTGAVIPFSAKDNGADLVETSYLIQGLLCARQYFDGGDANETALRKEINAIWLGVEWNWFRKNGENVLYWHWSESDQWSMNLPIRGWNECLITYILAASSPTYAIPKIVYDAGWARDGAMRNGNAYYGYTLPLGPAYGGPLFLAHYSFLGINPNGLVDAYANYSQQVTNHTKINYQYCIVNPKGWYGYSDQCWGLTASDKPGGYTASSPTNDIGVIAPTAALSSFPYTPQESMKALRFFYYKLGDKIWGQYGFTDAFSLHEQWFASSYLAIDQGPIVVMIENYRSGLLWRLLMSCPEVKGGMKTVGFSSPHL